MCAFIFFLLVLCSLSEAKGFTIDLIHRDSPLSPFYNSSMTPSELIKKAALRSISRSNIFHHLMDEKNRSIATTIIGNGGDYLMKFYIGTPPVERLAIADTGSDLIWIQCSPCDSCYHQDPPLFDPDHSSTFMSVSCDSQACSSLFTSASHSCGNSGECNYEVFYGDASFSKGKLGFESINFGDQNATFPNSIFGCGNENSMSGDRIENVTGLVGLGGGNVSLVSQIGDKIDHKFSYCLVPSNLTSTSKLQFGGDGIIIGREVVSTPLIIKSFAPTFYYLNLEEISVGQKSVKTGQNDGNIIIDSGTTLTLLEPSLYNDFVGLIKLVIGVEPEPIPPEPFDFCFTSSDDMHLTNIVFQFTQAKVVLNPQNFLIDYDSNLRCLAILSSPLQFSIFGNVAQTNFQVVYDLGAKKVSFAPTDCSKS